MATCVKCDAPVSREEPPRYDVRGAAPGRGPFCADCFPDTETARYIATSRRPDTLDPKEVRHA